MVHHRRRGRIVAMGVSAEALSPKCDTSERAKLRTVLIMIVNNNRARHRRLPDVTRALYRPRYIQHHHRIGATPMVRSTGERLSINHKHAHAHNRLLIRVARLQFIIRVGRSYTRRRACGFDRPDFINTVATTRANARVSANSRECARGAPPRCAVYRHGYLDISDVRSATDAFGSNL